MSDILNLKGANPCHDAKDKLPGNILKVKKFLRLAGGNLNTLRTVKIFHACCLLAILLLCGCESCTKKDDRSLTIKTEDKSLPEWTVMVFMNGDNNLEPWSLLNFEQMSRLAQNDSVNILIQYDRIGTYAYYRP